MAKVTYHINGEDFETLDEFYNIIYEQLIPGRSWGKSLDDLEDLVGGYCNEEFAFRLVWRNSGVSRDRLGYEETVRQLEKRLQRCHPGHRVQISTQLESAKRQNGLTVFDWLVEIFSWPHLELVLE
jgi:RNAse (barnase) inhibitor barstar